MKNSIRNERKERLICQLGGKCRRCGFSGHIGAFCFHHRYKPDKLYNISRGLCTGNDNFENVIVPEVAEKCVLLCNNCHGIIHSDRKEFMEFSTGLTRIYFRSQERLQRIKEAGLLLE